MGAWVGDRGDKNRSVPGLSRVWLHFLRPFLKHTNMVKNRNYLSVEMMLDRLDKGLKFYSINLFWFPEGQFSLLSDDPLDFEKKTLFPQ